MKNRRVQLLALTCVVALFGVGAGGFPVLERAATANGAFASATTPVADLLPNGGFEEGDYSPSLVPPHWSIGVSGPAAEWSWDATVSHAGSRSAKLSALVETDAWYVQAVNLAPNTNYLLSGWIKTEDVAHTSQSVDAGANLCILGTWLHTTPVIGTNDWTYVRFVFNSGETGEVSIAARLGFWSGVTTGTAWFDDVRVTPIDASDPHPAWKILVLIYRSTDFTPPGESRLIGSIPPAQLQAAEDAARRFVETDIPLLNSGNMRPVLTVRYPAVLSTLSPNGGGWWPSPGDTWDDRDPAFDSVIVIWQPTVIDQSSGRSRWIGSAAGLTPAMGTGQLYTTLIIEAATTYGHLNVFKHEWGHSITSYFDATGAAPKPAVNNHSDGTEYVHCGTGQYYTWVDETDANPIPNSIYNDLSGFAHDYYSGTTALATDPGRCLGATPLAWATGGPASKPGDPLPPAEALDRLSAKVEWVGGSATAMPPGWQKALQRWLEQVRAAVEGKDLQALVSLDGDLQRYVSMAVRHPWLSPADGRSLQDLMSSLMQSLGIRMQS